MKNLPFSLLNSNEIYTISCRINEACKLSVTNDGFVVTLCSNIDQANVDLAKGLGKSLNRKIDEIITEITAAARARETRKGNVPKKSEEAPV